MENSSQESQKASPNLDRISGDESDLYNGSKNKSSKSCAENATDAHPLMVSPGLSVSHGFPDLIPEKPRNKLYSNYDNKGEAHSSELDIEMSTESQDSFEQKLNFSLPALAEYNEKLPGK